MTDPFLSELNQIECEIHQLKKGLRELDRRFKLLDELVNDLIKLTSPEEQMELFNDDSRSNQVGKAL